MQSFDRKAYLLIIHIRCQQLLYAVIMHSLLNAAIQVSIIADENTNICKYG